MYPPPLRIRLIQALGDGDIVHCGFPSGLHIFVCKSKYPNFRAYKLQEAAQPGFVPRLNESQWQLSLVIRVVRRCGSTSSVHLFPNGAHETILENKAREITQTSPATHPSQKLC